MLCTPWVVLNIAGTDSSETIVIPDVVYNMHSHKMIRELIASIHADVHIARNNHIQIQQQKDCSR